MRCSLRDSVTLVGDVREFELPLPLVTCPLTEVAVTECPSRDSLAAVVGVTTREAFLCSVESHGCVSGTPQRPAQHRGLEVTTEPENELYCV